MTLVFDSKYDLQYTISASQFISYDSSSIVYFDTLVYDNNPGGFDTTTYTYTVPETGVYEINVDITTDYFYPAALYILVNSNNVLLSTLSDPEYTSSSACINGKTNLLLTLGDTITANIQTQIGSGNLLSGVYNSRFSITSHF